jgi:Zn-dependent protease
MKAEPAAVILLIGLLLTDRTLLCLAVILAAAVHECGHLLAARWLRLPIRVMRLDLLGARLELAGGLLSFSEEWLLCAAGPLFSLLLSVALSPLWKFSELAVLISCASLLLGILNLLPIRAFDGGRMLDAFLSYRFGAAVSEHALRLTSLLSLFLIWCGAVYLLLRVGDGLSLLSFSMSLFFGSYSFASGSKKTR